MNTPAPSDDSNRIVIAVTGANGGLGLGYCHRILRQLSLPPTIPTPDAFILRPTSSNSRPAPTTPSNPPPTLTLILACRSRAKAEKAIQILLKQHDLGLTGRKIRGEKEREGWREGLKLVYEELDVDKLGGEGGVFDFCDRVKRNYGHLTTLVLNAGMAALVGLSYSGAFHQLLTDPVGSVSEPNYMTYEAGWKSADGERGAVWGVNVLSSYVLAKELRSHLARSPPSLGLSPRVIYVSSKRADPAFLPPLPNSTLGGGKGEFSSQAVEEWDVQLLKTTEAYDASKYMSELVMARLDAEEVKVEEKGKVGEQRVRCVMLDPGVAYTGFAVGVLPFYMEILMVLTFYFARFVGSQVHNISPLNAASAMSYLTLVDTPALGEPVLPTSSPSTSVPSATEEAEAPLLETPSKASTSPAKYLSMTNALNKSYVTTHAVKDWEKYGKEYADAVLAECERLRLEWKGRK